MKQIIVNVSGLSVEEKQRVNEAMAEITGLNKMTSDLDMANWMYAPSSYTDDQITYGNENKSYENKEPTHTPQQVLEMARHCIKKCTFSEEVVIIDSSSKEGKKNEII